MPKLGRARSGTSPFLLWAWWHCPEGGGLLPADGGQPVAWANGERPEEVKLAGGANRTWPVEGNEAREIIYLARDGARLFLDNKQVIECPAGLPYVPATHRGPEGSRVRVTLGAGSHEIRL